MQDSPSDLTSPTLFGWHTRSSNKFPVYFLDGGEIIEVSPETFINAYGAEEINCNNLQNEETEEHVLVEGEELSIYMETVIAYKCRMCAYNTLELPLFVNHINSEHNDKSMVVYSTPETGVTISCDVPGAPSPQPDEETMTENVNSSQAEAPPQPSPSPPPPQLSPPPPEPSSPPQTPPPTPPPVVNMVIILCGQCRQNFATTDDCKEHMIKDHSLVFNEDIEMANLPNVDWDESEIKEEADDKHKDLLPNVDKKMRCDVRSCQFKFTTLEKMEQHSRCHILGRRREFKCLLCDEKYDRWRACSMHLWLIHKIDVDLLTCNICNVYKTVTKVKLETHMKIHNEERLYTCSDCGKKFKQSSQLRNHRVSHMNKKGSGTPRWYAAKTCDICHKEYADSKCLKKHVQAVHSKLRPYVCQVCGHSSARKAMLTLHFRQHTGEKPYACGTCDYRTGDHNSLRRHTMRHTGERPYRCPYCEYSSIQSNSIKIHLCNKHPGLEGLFSCTECSFRSISEDALQMHVSDHKYGVINTAKLTQNQMDVFPENVAAANLIYSCLNAGTQGSSVEANVTSSATSADGTMQTITIQIPGPEEECFLALIAAEQECVEEMDTGGITIPAEQSC